MAKLGRYITRNTYGRIEYECAYCYKTTASLVALRQHCRDSPAHEWCWRCDRVFPNNEALESHLTYSSSHNICTRDYCNEDFHTYEELASHNEQHHDWCRPCNWFADSEDELRTHDINQHFMCRYCGQYFQNDNNRRMATVDYVDSDEYFRGFHEFFPFNCPDCQLEFRHLSSLYQHVEMRPECRYLSHYNNCLDTLKHHLEYSL
ncbi:hypothetical protein AJ78_06605 [Emergomyces pasteurianus Ep9510]|uniref:C2H2-type domain-containing protein n=1 Tax=Emergomyces pasteurianus Ep9510 TaxID=1447872 RepID=A0A1J9QCI0_9EURO|nr:hypothetical protein AJ78_06605 [Emergomyces pasteurianus Ep9510]